MDIVETARTNLQRAVIDGRTTALPDPGWHWHSYCLHARDRAKRFTDPVEVIHSIQAPASNVGFEARMTGQALAEHAAVMERNCIELFPQFADRLPTFAESEMSFPETVTALNGRLVSSPLYNHIIHTMRCLSFQTPMRILEIGGGYGAPGRVWMKNGIHRPSLYVDVDFPESLFYAEVYLRTTMPDTPLVYLDDEREVPEVGIVLCPIARFAKLLEGIDIDLVVNTGSMQEMSEPYVQFYMDAIERARCDTLYSANYFAQPIDELMESMNFAAPVLSPNWLTEFACYYESRPRGVAEVLYRRTGHRPGAEREIRQLLAEGAPRTGEEFLKLFDLARRLDESGSLAQIVRATIERMPYIPKETLFLARRAGSQALIADLRPRQRRGAQTWVLSTRPLQASAIN